MKIVTIDQKDHSVLRRYAKPVSFPLDKSTNKLLDEMEAFIQTLKSPYGLPAGLAATQVGYPLQIIFINIPPEAKERRKDVHDVMPLMPLINPTYEPIKEAGKTKDWEGCYSVPDKMGEVWRYKTIYFEATTREGKKISREAHGFLARLLQHEIGHLNGEIYTDFTSEDCRFGSFDDMILIRQASQVVVPDQAI